VTCFIRFCNDERGNVKAAHPEYTVGDIAKDLGRQWGEVDESTKSKYEAMAEKDKARYERVNFQNYTSSNFSVQSFLLYVF
jgi:hypothetical protein